MAASVTYSVSFPLPRSFGRSCSYQEPEHGHVMPPEAATNSSEIVAVATHSKRSQVTDMAVSISANWSSGELAPLA